MVPSEITRRFSTRTYQNEYERLIRNRVSIALTQRFIDWLPGDLQDELVIENKIISHAPPKKGRRVVEYLLQIPHVEKKRAKAIYEEFGSIEAIVSSSIDRLASVRYEESKRVGRTLAKSIIKHLRSETKRANQPPLLLLKPPLALSEAGDKGNDLINGRKDTLGIKEEFEANKIRSGEISILFHSMPSYNELLAKLSAIDIIYSELCKLVNVPITSNPLQILEIESGSIWIKLFGESKVITLLVSLIQSYANHLYTKYTDEGKLSSIPAKLEHLDKILNFTKKLEENGIDSTLVKENIKKSTIIISTQLNNLLIGEPSIEVNAISYSVRRDLKDKYLTDSRKLMIDDGDVSNEV